MALGRGRSRTHGARGAGVGGREEPRQKMTRLVRGRGGGRKEGGYCSPVSRPKK